MKIDASEKIKSISARLKKSTVMILTREGIGTAMNVGNYVLLTNLHVISGFNDFTVRTWEKKEMPAFLIKGYERYDLAFILIPEILGKIKFPQKINIKEGETVVAIGNPMGYEFSITRGVVSAKDRRFGYAPDVNHTGIDFIQTDAALSPGNSGGPLVNLKSEVIGINSFITVADYSQNLNFALSVKYFNDASRFISDFVNPEAVITETICTVCAKVTDDKNYYCPDCGKELNFNSLRKEFLHKKSELIKSNYKENNE